MKIIKYIKDKNNLYKVIIDNNTYKLYDDVIIKNNLLNKKEITNEELDNIIKENNELTCYYNAIKYINKRLRTENEIRTYLSKDIKDNYIIDNTIKLLYNNNYINNDLYIKSYINDQVNIGSDGPNKIRKDLLNKGFNIDDIDKYLNDIDNNIWIDKINKYVNNKIKNNHSTSSYMLKNKIIMYLVNKGYYKDMVIDIIKGYDIIDESILDSEYKKARKRLATKYQGKELDMKVKEYLYRKGFRNIGDNYEE